MIQKATSSEVAEVKPVQAPQGLEDVAFAPKNGTYFYYTSNSIYAQGFTKDIKTGVSKNIWQSPLTEWNVSWPTEDNIAIASRSASNVPGFLYFLSPKTGSVTKVLGNVLGLSSKISPDGKSLILSKTVDGIIKTSLYTIATGNEIPLAVDTLAEKCVFDPLVYTIIYCATPEVSPTEKYQDDW